MFVVTPPYPCTLPETLNTRRICVLVDGVATPAYGVYLVGATTSLVRVESRDGVEIPSGAGVGEYSALLDESACEQCCEPIMSETV